MTKHDWEIVAMAVASMASWNFLFRLYLHWRGKIHTCSCGDKHKKLGE